MAKQKLAEILKKSWIAFTREQPPKNEKVMVLTSAGKEYLWSYSWTADGELPRGFKAWRRLESADLEFLSNEVQQSRP